MKALVIRPTRAILLLAVAPLVLLAGCGRSALETAKDLAPTVKEFGLNRFDDLDRDRDGMISEGELHDSARSPSFSEDERRLILHMESYRSWIGHVVRTETRDTVDLIPMPDGNGGFWYMPVPSTETYYYYGISREDLKTYPDRLAARR